MERSVFIKTTAFGGYDKADTDSALEALYSRIFTLESKVKEREALLEGYKQGRDEQSVSEEILSEDKKILAETQGKLQALTEKEERLEAELSEKNQKISELSSKLDNCTAEIEKANKRLELAGLNSSEALSKVFIEAQKSSDMLIEDAKKQAEQLKSDAHKLTEDIIIDANNKAAQIVYDAEKAAAETVARMRTSAEELKAASSNLKASMLEDIKNIGGIISKFKGLFDEFESSGHDILSRSEDMLKKAEDTLTAGGVPEFTSPKAIAPNLPEAPKLIAPNGEYSSANKGTKTLQSDIDNDLEKLMVMAKSLENDSSASPADEEKPSENGAADIDLDALAKMAEAL